MSCCYCKDREPLLEDKSKYVNYVVIEDSTLIHYTREKLINSNGELYQLESPDNKVIDKLDIEYCPVCGSELKKDIEEINNKNEQNLNELIETLKNTINTLEKLKIEFGAII